MASIKSKELKRKLSKKFQNLSQEQIKKIFQIIEDENKSKHYNFLRKLFEKNEYFEFHYVLIINLGRCS